MPAPWTYSYLIESTWRPIHLFRLSCTSHLSLKSASPAQLLWSNSSSRCHPGKPRTLGSQTLRWGQSVCLWVSGQSGGMLFVCTTVMCFGVWRICGWCKQNCVMTPLRFSGPSRTYIALLSQHDFPVLQLKHINNKNFTNMGTIPYVPASCRF